MTTGATGQLGLALPVQGELSGTWGNTVNNAITEYTNIAIAATLTLTNDGAVTLANTTGTDLASNITSSLTGAGTVTAQFAIVKVTGTLTTAKVVTAPSYSKTYVVVNAATGGIVTFKASGQTGVSIAVGESAWVYFNGTDYVKLSTTVASGVTSFQTSLSGLTPSTSTTGAVTLAGTLGTANGGTNLGGATPFTSGGVVYASSTSALATGSALTFDGTTATTPRLAFGGTTLPSAGTATIFGRSSDNNLYLQSGSGNGINFLDGSQNTMLTLAPTNLVFQISNAEQMRLTSTGLGIGTSSPTAKLTVSTTTNNGEIRVSDNATYYGSLSRVNATDEVRLGSYGPSQNITFYTVSSERMRLDSAGNLGIGTTSPSNFSGVTFGDSILDVNGVIQVRGDATNGAALMQFGGDTYRKAVIFTPVGTDTPYLAFSLATSGTTSSGSERMRIDSSGNVGIGTSSPATSLTVSGANTAARGQVSVIGASSADARITLYRGSTHAGSISNSSTEMYIDAVEAVPLAFYTSDTKRFQIGAAGQLGIGGATYGTAGQVLTSGGASAAPTWATASSGGFTLGTPVATTSGTTFTFTSIPAGVKQIIMTFDRVSLTGTAAKRIRIGDAGGIETTGYESASCSILSTTIAGSHDTEGFRINSLTNAERLCGTVVLTLQNASTYTWVASGVLGNGDGSVSVGLFLIGGTKSLSAELTQIQLGQTGGDTFDGGSVNIAYI